MADTHKKTIFKTISWRIIATITTMILVFIFTGDLVVTLGIGFFDFLIKSIVYYVHERVWNGINIGKTV